MVNKKLSQDKMFKSCLWGGISTSIFVAILISLVESKNRNLCGSAECFETLLQMWKFPIQLFVACMALAGLRATVFRSNQTSLQIEETLKQNVFKNYFDHKKDFMALVDDLEKEFSIRFSNKKALYNHYFPFNNPNNFNPESRSNDSDVSQLLPEIERFNELLKQLNENSKWLENGVSEDHAFICWLARMLVFLAEINIRFNDPSCSVSNFMDEKSVFADIQHLNKFPSDFSSTIYNISCLLGVLLNYCVSNSDGITISHLKVGSVLLDDKIRYISGSHKIS